MSHRPDKGGYVPPSQGGSVNSRTHEQPDIPLHNIPTFEPIALDYDGMEETDDFESVSDETGLIGAGDSVAGGVGVPSTPRLGFRSELGPHDANATTALRRASAMPGSKAYASLDDSSAGMLSSEINDGYSPTGGKQAWGEKSWDDRKRYISYYLPILRWLPEYNIRESLVYDLIAGLTVGAMAIPQSIAYASLVNLTPLQGMGTAFLGKLVYLIFGTNRVLSLGPEATTSIMLGHAISSQPDVQAAMKANDAKLLIELSTEYACVISLMTGVLTLAFGLLRLGFVDTVFSRPVLSGFICGVGVLLIVDQFPKLVGAPPCIGSDCDETTGKLEHIWDAVFYHGRVNWRTIILAICCISILFGFQWLKKVYPKNKRLQLVPQVFIVVILATIISYASDLASHGVVTLGRQDRGFPSPALPQVSSNRISNLFASSITLAVLGFIETQLVSKVVPSGSIVSPNRELVALGVVHIVASFFSCYTPYGSLTRTRVSVAAGARSPITAAIAMVILLLTMTLIIPVFQYMPVCVTASIIFYVGTSLLETHELKFTFKMRQWMDFALNAFMVIITIFLGVDTALFFAFAACLLLVIKQQNKPSMRLMGRLHERRPGSHLNDPQIEADPAGFFEVEESANVHNVELEGILIYQIDGPLFFSNAEGLKDRTRRIEYFGSFQSHPSEPERPLSLKAIVFDLTAVTTVDATAAAVLLEIIADYKERSVQVGFVKLRKHLYDRFERAGIIEALGGDQYLFRSTEQAMEAFQRELNEAQSGHAAPIEDVVPTIV